MGDLNWDIIMMWYTRFGLILGVYLILLGIFNTKSIYRLYNFITGTSLIISFLFVYNIFVYKEQTSEITFNIIKIIKRIF